MTQLILEALANSYLKLNNEEAIQFDEQDLINVCVILQEVAGGIAWANYEEQGIPMENRIEEARHFGSSLKALIERFTGINTEDFDYEDDEPSDEEGMTIKIPL